MTDPTGGAAWLAALAIRESLLVALTDQGVLGAGQARYVLEDPAAANRNTMPLAPNGTFHEAAAVVIERIFCG